MLYLILKKLRKLIVLNRYPLWKYIILILALILGLLYAIPNLYGEDPAVQIAADNRSIMTNEDTLVKIRNTLEKYNCESKSITLENGTILVKFKNTDIQMRARQILADVLGNKYIIALNLKPSTPKWLDAFGAKPIKLGLDLRGGVHFLIQVDMDTVVNKLQDFTINLLSNDMHQKNINDCIIYKVNKTPSYIEMRFSDAITCYKVSKYLIKNYNDLVFSNTSDKLLKVLISNDRIQEARKSAIEQNINILHKRVNQLGVAEPLIQQQGTDRIVVELPGLQDTARAKEILGATATLEFRLVNTNIDVHNTKSKPIPSDSEIKYTRNGQPIVLYKHVILTGSHITESTASQDELHNPQVNISLDQYGANNIYKFTQYNIGQPMATLFVEYKDSGNKDLRGRKILIKQEEVINVATIQSRLGHTFRITGINSYNEARELALLLRSGTLLAPIYIMEERTLGPTLGIENIHKGLQACLCGLIASILFMIVWYRTFGIIAIIALLINLLLIVGIMSLLPGATLTMPGIAGIVLILAIAIDANVLINERIKEELKNGRSIQKAIDKGYQNAFCSIIDANLTNLITALILYTVGTGSIKGFAITTIIGIITSMFTSIVATRAMVNLLYGGKSVIRLSI